MVQKLVVLAVAFVAVAVSAVKIPPQLKLKRCNLKDNGDKLDECLRTAIEDAIPKFKDGSPALGVPPLEPVEVTEIAVDTDKNTPISLSIKLKNLKISGVATSLELHRVHLDRGNGKKVTILANATNDRISMKGNYQSAGRLLAFPIEGEGPLKLELTDVKTQVRMDFEPVERKGVKYWDLVKMDYEVYDVANEKMRMENLIKGNKALDDSLNQILNENWRELDRQIRPAFSKALNLYFSGVTQRFFRRVPVKDFVDGTD